MSLGLGSYSGNAFYYETLSKFKQNKKVGLIRKILGELEPRPSGLYLPNNKVLKRFDGVRLSRITWNIIRGLYFYHFKEFLPEEIKKHIRIVSPGEQPPPDFLILLMRRLKGYISEFSIIDLWIPLTTIFIIGRCFYGTG